MSAFNGFIFSTLLLFLLASTICHALPDLHKQMSPHQLQSVFHVDNVDAVPQYEVVQLLHQHSTADSAAGILAHNRRRRRSIELASNAQQQQQQQHHVKKDLSKNAYYSELKQKASASINQLPHDDVSTLKVHNVSFSAFGEHLNLTLKPTQGLFKGGAPHALRMWNVRSEPNATHGLDLQEIVEEKHQSKHEIGEVFQDEANMAAILMRRHMETGDLIMEGSIGHDMIIKPLPHELSPSQDEVHHVVYKRETAPADHLSDFAFMEPDDLAANEKLERLQRRAKRSTPRRRSFKDFEDITDDDEGALDADAGVDDDAFGEETAESRTRTRRQAPYIIYPEVLVIVDYDGYRLHGGDNLQVKRYFISFWNGVDLRYRLLKGPRIRISIAGIIISRGRDATPYLERNRVGRDAIDSAAALTDMGKYLFRERRLPVYDIAVAITKYDMCRRRKGGRCTKGTAGFAYVGGACVVNKRLEKVNSVAIIEDTGGFSGIIVAAHEVGHLLGAVHDGSPPPSYLGGPGAQRCRWEDGYIMSDLRHTERGFRWSPCTVQSFHHFLNGDTATCLHNAPHEDSALGRSLPGTLLSLDAQCRRDRGTYACFKDERVCAQLFCFDAQTGYCVAYRPAAEGSACGNGLHCLDGRCTPLPSNIIPDYGHQYRLVYNNKNNKDADNSAENVENSSEETESNESNEDDDEDQEDTEDNGDSTEAGEEEEEDDEEIGGTHANNGLIDVKGKKSSSSEEILQDNRIEQSGALKQRLSTTTTTTKSSRTTPTTTTTKSTTKITTTTTTTRKPKRAFEYLTHFFEPKNSIQQNGGGGVVVKTSKSSSVRSESGNKGSTNVDKAEHYTQTLHNTETPTTTTTTQQPSVLKLYTQEFRKQLEYYLHLIQESQQTQNTLNFINKQHQQQQLQLQKEQLELVEKQRTNALNSNYSVTNNNNSADVNTGDDHVNDTETNDDVDDNVASNEAIERQKRKFQNQQQNQQQQVQTYQTIPTTTTAMGLSIPIKRNNQYGVRLTATATTPTATRNSQQQTTIKTSTTTTTPLSFLDAYLKKLQALQHFANVPAVPTTTSSVTSSVSAVSSTTTSSTTATAKATANKQQQQQKFETNYGSPFLKRTLYNTNSKSQKYSSQNNSNHHQTHHQQQQQQTETIQPQNSPAYVTNFIGDNTNNLPSVAVLNNTPIDTSTTTTTATITLQSQQQQKPQPVTTTTTTKTKKIKTQKLIRRPLRTQIK